MIKTAITRRNGRLAIVVGVTEADLERLKARPHFISGEVIGLDNMDVVLIQGDNEVELLKGIAEFEW